MLAPVVWTWLLLERDGANYNLERLSTGYFSSC
jgi:hypothetical protein